MSLMRMTLVLAGICWVKSGFCSSNDMNSCWLDESDLVAVAAVRSKRWNQPSAPTATTKFCQTGNKKHNVGNIITETFMTRCCCRSFQNLPFLCCRRLQLQHRSAAQNQNTSWVREINLWNRESWFLYWPCPHRFWWPRVWSRHSCTPAAFHWCHPQSARSTRTEKDSTFILL